MQELERITARRSELDTLAEELAKQLQEVQAEREELVIAERVLNRLAEQDRAAADAARAVTPTPARVAGQAVLLIPHRSETPDEAVLPADYRKILAIVRAVDGPVQVRGVGEELGLRRVIRAAVQPDAEEQLRKARRVGGGRCGAHGGGLRGRGGRHGGRTGQHRDAQGDGAGRDRGEQS
ncbi:hypothetical protein [Streptomyces sp. NPDC002758]